MLMKRFIVIIVAIILGFPLNAFAAGGAFTASGAKGAVLMEAASGRVIAEKNSYEKLPVASTTKIMTALIALEQSGLDEAFTVDAEAIMVEGSSMGLVEGDIVTLKTLVWGMMLASGNDAANAAAVRIAGDIEAFVGMMNEKAKEIGMKDTLFTSPSGLEAGGEPYSTAYDMALLAHAALANEDFCEIVSSKSGKLYYGNPPYHRWMTNHNRLLWQCEDCIGIKTGFTKKAGRCLVTAARRDGLTLIAVTLGCPDDFTIHHSIYDETFKTLSFIDASSYLSNLTIPVTGAEELSVPVGSMWPLGAFMTEEEKGHFELTIFTEPFLYAPVNAGQVIGSAEIKVDGVSLNTVPLTAIEDRPYTKYTDTRSVIQRVRDFFNWPQYYIM